MFHVTIEDEGLLVRLDAVARRADAIPDEIMQQVADRIVLDIHEHMAETNIKPGGKLYNTVIVSHIGPGFTEIEVGDDLPYPKIQNFGGFIHATPTVAKRHGHPFNTYKMSQFFWAMWYATNDEKFKAYALGSHKKGGVTIKPKHYFYVSEVALADAAQLLGDLIIGTNTTI